MSSFDPSRAYSWLIFDLQPGAVFNGTFNPNAINFITTQFANSTTGGQFSLEPHGRPSVSDVHAGARAGNNSGCGVRGTIRLVELTAATTA